MLHSVSLEGPRVLEIRSAESHRRGGGGGGMPLGYFFLCRKRQSAISHYVRGESN